MRQLDFVLPQAGAQFYLLDAHLHEGNGGESPLPLGQQPPSEDFMRDLRTGNVVLHPGGELFLRRAGGLGGLCLALRLFLRFFP